MAIKTNIKEVSKQIDNLIKDITGSTIEQAMHLALESIAYRSATDYWIQTTLAEAILVPPDPDLLTVRTGRLLGSLLESPRFSRSELPTGIESMMGVKPTTIEKMGGVREGVREVRLSGNIAIGIIGTEVPYAAKHEEGSDETKARPYLQPAAEDQMPYIENIIKRTIEHRGKINGLD